MNTLKLRSDAAQKPNAFGSQYTLTCVYVMPYIIESESTLIILKFMKPRLNVTPFKEINLVKGNYTKICNSPKLFVFFSVDGYIKCHKWNNATDNFVTSYILNNK